MIARIRMLAEPSPSPCEARDGNYLIPVTSANIGLWHGYCCLFAEVCDMTKGVLRFVACALMLPVLSATVSYGADREDLTGPTGVTLYEVSERVTFDPDPSVAGVIRRNASSPLQGFAALGTPLCPSKLMVSVPYMEGCTVIATGTDSVSTVTGTGPVSGTFDVVVNAPGNSSVHVPDLPVISGMFNGGVDLSLAVLHRVPQGAINGTFTMTQVLDPTSGQLFPLLVPIVVPFSGTFRMPFALDAQGKMVRSNRKAPAFYLADDMRTRVAVQQVERSVGFATVRLELSFAP